MAGSRFKLRGVGGGLIGVARRVARRFQAGHEDPTGPVRVVFEKGEGTVTFGTTLLAAAVRFDVDIDHFCGGQCSCGTCRVQVVEGATALSEMSSREHMVLGDASARRGDRLACQARVLGSVRVRVPRVD